jgi:hypothetical protein
MGTLDNGRPDRKRPPQISVQRQQDDPNRWGSVLSDAEKAAIREKARTAVRKEQEEREEAALYAEYLKEERRAADPDEELVPIYLELALHSPYIMLDGTQYMNQTQYHVTAAVFRVLVEQMNRGWAHEMETEVREARTRRRVTPPSYIGYGNFLDNRNPRDLKVSSAQLAGTPPAALLGV